MTKNVGLLDDYEEHLNELGDLLVESESDERINSGSVFQLSSIHSFLGLLDDAQEIGADVDRLLPHRPEGNLVLYCPACPEPGFKCFLGENAGIPAMQRTLDGNFQCNQYKKNSNPDDVSLCKGKAHFPVDRDYRAYLKEDPGSTEDKKKFKNMAITGTVNAQCSHVFILSSVDLHYGEKFSNGDYALVSSLRLYNGRGKMTFELRFEINDVDEMATYDIACEYTIHLESRIAKNFPDVLDKVKKMRWGVPSLHIQGHQEDSEQWWPEANQLGPHNDWNHKKTAGIGEMLASELRRGKQQFEDKLRHFNGLSASAGDLVKKWKIMDRTPRRVGKEIISVYRHNTIPSQQAIYQRMLAEDERFEGSMVPRNRIARFINDALMIEEDQRKIQRAVKESKEQDLQSLASEIAKRRSKLDTRLTGWRREQREIMPQVGDKVALQSQQSPSVPVEHERLFLPSDFVELERQGLRLETLGSEEARWREGQAFDALRATQSVVKTLRALLDHTARHDRQQKQRSRAGDQLRDIIRRRDFRMGTYDVARKAMIAL
ncbi:CxC2 domain-containing protein [Favolaschia claudopus]|uniref:CxC2 domain-containing protein n=1 Tax=Favolaschia claudopus TaxID=2862362 RepID=A0AAW0ASY7_9AGAR